MATSIEPDDNLFVPIKEGAPGVDVLPDDAKGLLGKATGTSFRLIWSAIVVIALVATVVYYRHTGVPLLKKEGVPLYTTTSVVTPVVTQLDISKWQTVPFTNMGWVNIPIPVGYAIRTKADNSPRYRYAVDGAEDLHYEASVSPGQMHVLAPDDGYTNYSYRLDFPGNGTFSWHFIPLSQVGKGE